MEALTSYSTLTRCINLFVAVFILSEVVALHKLGYTIILFLENSGFMTYPSDVVNIVVII